MLNVQARRQLLFSKAGGRRSFRQLERLDITKKEPPDFVCLRLSRSLTNKIKGGSHVLLRYRFAFR